MPATLQSGTYTIQKALTGIDFILSDVNDGSVIRWVGKRVEAVNEQWEIAQGANNTWTFRSRAGTREYLQLSDTGADVKRDTALRVGSTATNFILQRDGEANQYNILTNAGGILFAVSAPTVRGENLVLQPAQNVEADYWTISRQ